MTVLDLRPRSPEPPERPGRPGPGGHDDARRPREGRRRPVGLPRPATGRGWGDDREPTPPRSLVVALVLAAASLMALDAAGALAPVRGAVAAVAGPAESAVSAAARPLTAAPDWVRSQGALREDVARLRSENDALRGRLAAAPYAANRLREYDGLSRLTGRLGYAVVPAHVVGIGPAQSFADTVTLDAGSAAGLRPDLTVVNAQGLVGRVLSVTRTTATVLLVTDADSVVGGRVGTTMDVGTLRGRGEVGPHGLLDLELVDRDATPARDDAVVTWGSQGRGPYVAGVPIGRVTKVVSSVRETAQRAEIEPYVDFGALDLVGVVVPDGTRGDRGVIEADGTLVPGETR